MESDKKKFICLPFFLSPFVSPSFQPLLKLSGRNLQPLRLLFQSETKKRMNKITKKRKIVHIISNQTGQQNKSWYNTAYGINAFSRIGKRYCTLTIFPVPGYTVLVKRCSVVDVFTEQTNCNAFHYRALLLYSSLQTTNIPIAYRRPIPPQPHPIQLPARWKKNNSCPRPQIQIDLTDTCET